MSICFKAPKLCLAQCVFELYLAAIILGFLFFYFLEGWKTLQPHDFLSRQIIDCVLSPMSQTSTSGSAQPQLHPNTTKSLLSLPRNLVQAIKPCKLSPVKADHSPNGFQVPSRSWALRSLAALLTTLLLQPISVPFFNFNMTPNPSQEAVFVLYSCFGSRCT